MSIGIKIYSFLKGRLVGKDSFGNLYYESRCSGGDKKRKRWVLYNGLAEPSKVPPEWHGWLHYTFDQPITASKHKWQVGFLPNLTGTRYAYMPPGHPKRGMNRDKATGDYDAWKP